MMRSLGKWQTWALSLLILLAVTFPFLTGSRTWTALLIVTAINIMLTQGLNILTGFVGIVSIGQAGFFAVGAYASALLMTRAALPFMVSLPLAVVLAGCVGFIVSLPSGRVRHFYLTMLTFAFGIIVYNILKEWRFVGGVNGITSIPSPTLGSLNIFGFSMTLQSYYVMVVVMLILVTWLISNIITSYIGRAMLAIQYNEMAAGVMGIWTGKIRQFCFVSSACFSGLAGVLYAHYITFLGPDSFSDMVSVYILVYAVLGGLGNLVAPFLGAGILTILPQELHIFAQYQLLIYGVLLFFSFMVFPRGIAGLMRLRTKFIRPALIPTPEQIEASFNFGYLQSADANRKQGEVILQTKNVSKYFDGVAALDGVDLTVCKGEIHGLVGPNGSGKSTLVNVITGIYKVSAGKISFDGQDITDCAAPKIAAGGIARNFQSPQLSPHLTVLESVLLGAHMNYKATTAGVVLSSRRSRTEETFIIQEAGSLLKELELFDIRDDLTKNLPYGKQRMVELARSLLCRPRLLILDEPAAGLSEEEMDELGNLLRKLKSIGLTVIIIEHHMGFLLNLIDSVTVLDNGQLIYAGDVQGMRASTRVQQAYLGSEADGIAAIGS